jgi:hypothetical protein
VIIVCASICAAPARGNPRKWPVNCLKITKNKVLLWDALIEEPSFAISLRFWHAWKERLARPDQRRLYRKSLQWSQSRLLFPGPNGAPLGRAALRNALASRAPELNGTHRVLSCRLELAQIQERACHDGIDTRRRYTAAQFF